MHWGVCQSLSGHPHLLIHSTTERSCQWVWRRYSMSGCSGLPPRLMQTDEHTHTPSPLQARLYSKATVSFGQATVSRLPNTYVWVSPHSLTFDQTDYSLNRDWTEHHVHCGFHYQVWFHVSAGMTHSLGSEPDLERYLFNSMLRIVFLNFFSFSSFLPHKLIAWPLLTVL